MSYMEFKGKTVEEAVTAASVELGIISSELEYEVIENEEVEVSRLEDQNIADLIILHWIKIFIYDMVFQLRSCSYLV